MVEVDLRLHRVVPVEDLFPETGICAFGFVETAFSCMPQANTAAKIAEAIKTGVI